MENLIKLITDTIESLCTLDYEISLDKLEDNGGIYAEFGSMINDTVYYDKSAIIEVPISFLCKDVDKNKCIRNLQEICMNAQELKNYPADENFKWLDAQVKTYPINIGKQEDAIYTYSCIITNKIYFY